MFHGTTSDGRPWPYKNDGNHAPRVTSTPCVASLQTSPDIGRLAHGARQFIVRVLQGHEPLSMYGVDASERDLLVDVRETFESLCDAYGGTENECGNDDGGPATDEEWDTDAWEV